MCFNRQSQCTILWQNIQGVTTNSKHILLCMSQFTDHWYQHCMIVQSFNLYLTMTLSLATIYSQTTNSQSSVMRVPAVSNRQSQLPIVNRRLVGVPKVSSPSTDSQSSVVSTPIVKYFNYQQYYFRYKSLCRNHVDQVVENIKEQKLHLH